MKPLVDPKYTFPVAMLMTLFAYHTVLTKWDGSPNTAFLLALAGFLGVLGLTVATFYKVYNLNRSNR